MKFHFLILACIILFSSCDNSKIETANINLELYEKHAKAIYSKGEASLEFDINLSIVGNNPFITLTTDSLLYSIQINQSNHTQISISQFFPNIGLDNYNSNIVIHHNGIPKDGYFEKEVKICNQPYFDIYSQYSQAGITSFSSLHYTAERGVIAFSDHENTIWLLDRYE